MHPPAAVALAALPLLLLAACKQGAAPVAKADRPVQVVRVAFTPEHPSRDFVGIVRARTEADLGFRVAGKIIDRPVNVGDRVSAGDVVARLDPQDLQLQAESAEAELAAATSNLTQAAAEEERYASLKARGYAAIADYDRRKATRDEADGRLQRARRALELARNQLTYAELKADSDGVITTALAEPGQVVAVGQAVVRLARSGEKEAVVALPETWLAEAGKATARVALWSAPGRSFTARLRELSPQADPATRTYAARFTITDADDTVALGMTATVTMIPGGETRVTRLPLSAVINRGSGPAVYVVDESSGALVLSPVTVASFSEETARITTGLREGDRVVTLGVQKLEAGARVRTVDLR